MLTKFAFAAALAASCVFAEDVPSDLTVSAFTGKAMDKAVGQVLRRAAAPTNTVRPFAALDLIRSLNAKQRPSVRVLVGEMDKQCAIPLREVKGGSGHRMDPLAKPAGNGKFDPMAKPAPIKPCHFDIPSAK